METNVLSSAAQSLIAKINNGDNNADVFECWNQMVSELNKYPTYSSIPFIPEVPRAMYMYVMKFTSKKQEETSIRAITSFGVVMNAVEHTDNANHRLDYLAILSIILSYYRKRFGNVSNFSLFPIVEPKVTEYGNETVLDYGDTKKYIDAIFLYIYNCTGVDKCDFWGDESLRNKYTVHRQKFYEEYAQMQQDVSVKLDGGEILLDCNSVLNVLRR